MVLPIDKVVYYAQEVCAVIATERYIAADAHRAGRASSTSRCRRWSIRSRRSRTRSSSATTRSKKTNHIWHWEAGDRAATDQVFAEAAHVVKQHMYLPRIHVASIETCGMVADFDKATGKLRIYMTSQAPHAHRTVFALVSGPARAEDPDHLARHRRRLRRQGAGLPRLRLLRGRQPGHRQAGQVDRGPQREPAGRQLRPRLPHDRRDGRRRGRQDHRRCGSRPSPTTAPPTPPPTRRSSRPACSASPPARTT